MSNRNDRLPPLLPGPPGGVLGWVATIIAGVVAALLGVFFFAVFLALILVASVVVAIRVWWLRRQLTAAAGTEKRRAPNPPGKGATLEGEFHRVDRTADKDT